MDRSGQGLFCPMRCETRRSSEWENIYIFKALICMCENPSISIENWVWNFLDGIEDLAVDRSGQILF